MCSSTPGRDACACPSRSTPASSRSQCRTTVGQATPAGRGGRGLANMRARAGKLGATLNIVQDAQGTRVTLLLPLGDAVPAAAGPANPVVGAEAAASAEVIAGDAIGGRRRVGRQGLNIESERRPFATFAPADGYRVGGRAGRACGIAKVALDS